MIRRPYPSPLGQIFNGEHPPEGPNDHCKVAATCHLSVAALSWAVGPQGKIGTARLCSKKLLLFGRVPKWEYPQIIQK